MRLTASKLPLAGSCCWGFRPDVDAPVLPSSDDAALGSLVHAEIETVLRGNAGIWTAEARPYLAAWQAWHREAGAPALTPEVAGAYDPATGAARVLPSSGGHRDYSSVAPHEICGTADAVLVRGDTVEVYDWKVQAGPDGYAEPVERNAQLRFLALAFARAHGASSARTVIVRLSPEDWCEEAANLDDLELDAVAAEVRDLIARIPDARPVPGDHCAQKYCPALAVCPAAHVASVALVASPQPLAITADNAAPLLERLRVVEAACEAVRGALKAHADANGGIALPGGRVWRRCDDVRESVVLDGPTGAEARAILARHGCDGAVRERASATWTDIEARIRETHGAGREAAKARRAAMDALRGDLAGIGAIKSSSVAAYREQKARE